MKGENWQNGQIVLTDDLNRAQSAKDDSIRDRRSDALSSGVLVDVLSEFAITKSLAYANRIDVAHGTAYDGDGERIVIADTIAYDATRPNTTSTDGLGGFVLTRQSTGSIAVILTDTPNAHKYVFIKYLKTTDTTVVSGTDTPAQIIYPKFDDGYEVVVFSSATALTTISAIYALVPSLDVAKYVFIGSVNLSSGTITAGTIDTSLKTYSYVKDVNLNAVITPKVYAPGDITYALNTTSTLEHHVQCIGTGVVSPTNPHGLTSDDLLLGDKKVITHEKYLHNKGIAVGKAGQLDADSALMGTVAWTTLDPDEFVIEGFNADQSAVADSNTVDFSAIPDYRYAVLFRNGPALVSQTQYVLYLNTVDTAIHLAVKTGVATPGDQYTIEIRTGVFPGIDLVTGIANPVIETVKNAADWKDVGTGVALPHIIPLWETEFSQTRVLTAISQYPPAPDGLSNFTYKTDLRQFGTIGSDQLNRDSATDTVTIDHNVTVAKTATITTALAVTGTTELTGKLDALGAVTALDDITVNTVGKNVFVNTGMVSPKKVPAISVDSYSGDLSAVSVATITIPAYAAPNFIVIQASALLGTRTSGGSTVSTYRNVSLNATPIGQLQVSTIAAGSGDDVTCQATTGFTQHLIAGVGYVASSINTITLDAQVASGSVTADSQHRLVVMMG